MPAIEKLLLCGDNEVTQYCFFVLMFITDGNNEKIQLVLNSNKILTDLLKILESPSSPSLFPALKLISNLTSGDDMQTQLLLNHNILTEFLKILDHPKANIRKEVYYSLSNVCAGTKLQLDAVLEHPIAMRMIRGLEDCDAKVRLEAAHILYNAAYNGVTHHKLLLINSGMLEAVKLALRDGEPDLITVFIM